MKISRRDLAFAVAQVSVMLRFRPAVIWPSHSPGLIASERWHYSFYDHDRGASRWHQSVRDWGDRRCSQGWRELCADPLYSKEENGSSSKNTYPVALDISADLLELGRTPVAVVCSGCKSILDIPRTLEYLVREIIGHVTERTMLTRHVQETQGVAVATMGPKSDFPAFYAESSKIKVRIHRPRSCKGIDGNGIQSF
jgi:Indigoidine synthase A like protein